MMNDTYFPYDSSITVPLSRVPVWPYTLDYRIPHTCHGTCPQQSWPIWELPINELDRREDPEFDEELTGCPLVSSCTNIQVIQSSILYYLTTLNIGKEVPRQLPILSITSGHLI